MVGHFRTSQTKPQCQNPYGAEKKEKGKKKKGRDASHLLGFTSERADAVGADED